MSTFTPKYADAAAIDRAIRSISTRGGTFRRDIDDLLNSAIAHHASAKNGSIGTVLSKVYQTIINLGFVNHRGIRLKLVAVFGENLIWNKKDKTFSGKVECRQQFENNGATVNYWDCPFWEMVPAKDNSQAWDWEGTLDKVFNGKSVNKRLGDMTAKQREQFQAYRELFGLLRDKIVTPADACQYASEMRGKFKDVPAPSKRQLRRVTSEGMPVNAATIN